MPCQSSRFNNHANISISVSRGNNKLLICTLPTPSRQSCWHLHSFKLVLSSQLFGTIETFVWKSLRMTYDKHLPLPTHQRDTVVVPHGTLKNLEHRSIAALLARSCSARRWRLWGSNAGTYHLRHLARQGRQAQGGPTRCSERMHRVMVMAPWPESTHGCSQSVGVGGHGFINWWVESERDHDHQLVYRLVSSSCCSKLFAIALQGGAPTYELVHKQFSLYLL